MTNVTTSSGAGHPPVREVLSLIRTMEDSCRELYELLAAFAGADERTAVGGPGDESPAVDGPGDESPAPDGPGNVLDEAEARCQILFNDLAAGTSVLLQCAEPLRDQLNHAYYAEMAENIDAALCDTIDRINADQNDRAAKLLNTQLLPFLQELWEEIYFWGTVYPDEKRMDSYYRDEFALHHRISHDKPEGVSHRKDSLTGQLSTYKYKFSIFIPVFNKLDYTKQCITAIAANTDLEKYPCELILLNDGSTDGTQEYFETLDLGAGVDKKVIYLRRNVKTLIFSLAFRVCEGEYFVFVNNDTLVTKGWLDNLLACIESDPAIISATPCTPNTSNYQSDIDGRYPCTSVEEVLRHENRTDPALWEIRARIMPVIALYRTESVNRIGFADRLFYTMEFWDDDFSLRARRAGYKQMLCRDTYCHHFGSVTGKAGQVKENTLEKGRALFKLKNHVDAWGEDFCYDYQTMAFVKSAYMKSAVKSDSVTDTGEPAAILGIDCGFGDTLLQIKSYLRSRGRAAKICTVSCEDTYIADLRPLSEHCLRTETVLGAVQGLGDGSLDYVFFQKPLEHYADYDRLLSALYSKLKKGGLLLFSATNVYYRPFLESFLNLSFPDGKDCVTFINIGSLQNRLRNLFSQMECIAQTEGDAGAEAFREAHMKGNTSPSVVPLLTARYLKFCCRK